MLQSLDLFLVLQEQFVVRPIPTSLTAELENVKPLCPGKTIIPRESFVSLKSARSSAVNLHEILPGKDCS